MITSSKHVINSPRHECVMRMKYGFNETDGWWPFALGPARERIWEKHRELNTSVIRTFLFDKHAPDPTSDWSRFEAYIQAVLNSGAVPMITFANFPSPHDCPRAIRRFTETCGEVTWGCVERWGAAAVRNWFWCIWNEPNNVEIGGGLSFDTYRTIYEAVASEILRWLPPTIDGQRPLIGGPAVDGFQTHWFDWVWRFVNEIDQSLFGFISWHHYGDWRPVGQWDAPRDDTAYERLLLDKTIEYKLRSEQVRHLLRGQHVLNICGELHAHSHHVCEVSRRFNQTLFGAVYYASALVYLIHGGADLEMLWVGTETDGPYGVMDRDGLPTPVYHAKRLLAQNITLGDLVSYPRLVDDKQLLEIIVANKQSGKSSVLLINQTNEEREYRLPLALTRPGTCAELQKIDHTTGNRIVVSEYDGVARLTGYGIAVITEVLQFSSSRS